MKLAERIVLGFDPGIAITGWAVVTGEINAPQLLDCGSIETDAKQPTALRLAEIYQNIQELLDQFKPDRVVVEELFVAHNLKTVMQVAQARGIILAACGSKSEELAPEEIIAINPKMMKQQLTGYGQATKKQIAFMVSKIFNLTESPQLDDVMDAIALAYTGLIHAQKATIFDN